MQILQIKNKTQETLATISRTRDGKIALQVEDQSLRSAFEAMLNQALRSGLPLHSSRNGIVNGQQVILDEVTQVTADDEQFISALADWVSQFSYGGQRGYGVLMEDPE